MCGDVGNGVVVGQEIFVEPEAAVGFDFVRIGNAFIAGLIPFDFDLHGIFRTLSVVVDIQEADNRCACLLFVFFEDGLHDGVFGIYGGFMIFVQVDDAVDQDHTDVKAFVVDTFDGIGQRQFSGQPFPDGICFSVGNAAFCFLKLFFGRFLFVVRGIVIFQMNGACVMHVRKDEVEDIVQFRQEKIQMFRIFRVE